MSKLNDAYDRIDAENADDPEEAEVDGETVPAAVLYGRRMTSRLEAFRPGGSDALKIACRAQHIRRFDVPRDTYPMDRAGYHRWRTDLAKKHAEHTAKIMAEVGYDEEAIARAKSLLRKKNLAKDEDAQTLEDVACLVFLEYYYAPFIADKEDDKVVVILQKTWKKMSEAGRAAAKEISLEGRAAKLLDEALA